MSQINRIDNNSSLAVLGDEWQRAFILWLQEFKSQNTREAYHLAWNQFTEWTNNLHPGAVESENIRAWKIHLQKDYSPAAVNLKLSAISSFYKYININNTSLRDDNPSENVRQLRVNPYGKATLLVDDQDIQLLYSIDRSALAGKRDYAIILMFLTTGVRLAAIANATLSDLRRQGAIMFFHYVSKGNKEYEKRLPANTIKALQDYLGERKEGSLFGMERWDIQYMIEKRCNIVFGKGHGITVHSLRHTAANNAAKNGSVQDVRALLDHESTRVTAVYLDHITREQGERMSELLDERYN